MPGPVPKRSDQRRRRNKAEGGVSSAPGALSVTVPEPEPDWHPLARDWFVSLGESGQSVFYEPSDWQIARIAATAMSRELVRDSIRSTMLAEFMSIAESLLTTEGDRRRVRLELERDSGDPVEDPGVAIMDKYRKAAQ